MNNDLIRREYVKAKMFDIPKPKEGENFWDGVDTVLDIINNAPAVDIKDQIAGAYNEGYMCGNREAEKARPQGEFTLNDLKGYLLFYGHSSDAVEDTLINFESYVKGRRGGAE